MLVYAAYLFSLQIVRGFEYKSRATQVAQRITPIPAQRGEIYDRNADVPIVLNIDSFAVDVIPAELPAERYDDVTLRLSTILDIPVGSIREKLTSDRMHLYRPIEIASKTPVETIYFLAEHIDMFPGVAWHNKPIRSYLETGTISHVLGYVNDITTEELQILYNRGYKSGDVLGKRGMELEYDAILRGIDGAHYGTVDVRGRSVDNTGERTIAPQNGKDIILTIDRNIQELAEKALGERIGSVVVLKPHTGEILALVSYPWFDPNLFYQEGGGDAFNQLSLDPRYPLLNRTIQSKYAPASTFKVLLMTALLEEEAIDPSETVECTGSVLIGDWTFNCWKEEGHGEVNLWEALEESCNVFFGTVGLKYLGIERISDYMRRFGFGERTGIDLPGEVFGLAPTPRWKELTKGVIWVGGDTVNTSIGQGFTEVSPLQLANMVALIANDGVVYVPHILSEERDASTGDVVNRIEPRVLRRSSISDKTFDSVQRAMRSVVTHGTAKVVVTTKAVEVAGKTGTGEVGLEEHWNSWFVAYAPYEGPREDMVVVVVMVEAVNEWEWWAPKAANIIFQGIFADQAFDEAVDTLNVHWYFSS